MSEQESMSERELAEYLADTAYSTEPRSVGEALAAADEEIPAESTSSSTPEAPIEVEDAPTQPAPELPEAPDAPTEVEETEEEAGEEIEDEHVAWATKKYGDDPEKWAMAAHHQEQHISRLAQEKREAEQLAGEWYEYAQGIQQQASVQAQQNMPLSSQEEEWIESSLVNPYQAARAAALQGNFNLYNGVVTRVAEENPIMAAQIGTQVQMEMQQLAAQDNGQYYQPPSLAEEMGASIQRLGIDLNTYGEPMSAKVAELGEHHPYVHTILEGEQGARDIALMAVYDLVRTSAMSTRRVRSEERENQIKHEAELRRQAAGVVTGGPHQENPPAQSPMLQAMEDEWRARGQWSDE